ncbi:hypothetical protein LEN26_010262 [Aphanomyces euteiches]|nr:hypothetical protein AeMF1_018501 [Aphanomyces euteiches]KAH9122434.1 hypothetical protein LEN26_010262 [Aphanomyces euteiches]KAH9194878.1 hypothetical protein AeNC1_003155 [Aphanomyces euteiches]
MTTLRQRAIHEKTRDKDASRPLAYKALDDEDKQIVLDRIRLELVPLLASLKPLQAVSIGVNAVTRSIERKRARVLIIALDPSSQNVLHHVLTMAETFEIPICVLSASSQELGGLVSVKSAAAIALNSIDANDASNTEHVAQVKSLSEFLSAKASPVVS